jgi:recombinational DNA repair protein (RecF pathway)
MRHKYSTAGIVLHRTPLSEASSLVTLLTSDVGLIRARAQGLRKPGAKMASSLQTLSESEVVLVRGKDGWRLAGALCTTNWFSELSSPARVRAGRIASLLFRLLSGESADPRIFTIYMQFLQSLQVAEGAKESAEENKGEDADAAQDAAECLTALRLLHVLGVDAGDVPGGLEGAHTPELLQEVSTNRADFILRINRGIAASGL